MSGAHTNTQRSEPDLADQNLLDLDALLAQRQLKPAKVKLAGYTYSVRTDLTAAEVVQYQDLVAGNSSAENFLNGLRLLIGEDAERLDTVLDGLPKRHLRAAMRGFLNASGCFVGIVLDDDWEDAAGEDSAS
jgi:hypothetical protein